MNLKCGRLGLCLCLLPIAGDVPAVALVAVHGGGGRRLARAGAGGICLLCRRARQERLRQFREIGQEGQVHIASPSRLYETQLAPEASAISPC